MSKDQFVHELNELLCKHNPSNHSFFRNLETANTKLVRSNKFLEELYNRYQSAMHATRVMIYYLPYLDPIELRMIKARIISEDDNLPNGDSHHFQLRRTWAYMLQREPFIRDAEFGALSLLESRLDQNTSQFVKVIRICYPNSLGAWTVVEGLAHEWIGALSKGLTPHFPRIGESDYFRENYKSKIELQHAATAIKTTINIIEQYPSLVEETIRDANLCANALDYLWDGFDDLLCSS